ENGKGLGGAVAAGMLQQSLIIVRRNGLERFLIGLLNSPWTDGEVSPEETMRRQLTPFDFIQLPYGRSRPIDFTRRHFYAQQLGEDELCRFLRDAHTVGLREPGRRSGNSGGSQNRAPQTGTWSGPTHSFSTQQVAERPSA